MNRANKVAASLSTVALLLLLASAVSAQSLKTVPVPTVANKGQYIKNTAVAAQLGKAFFWDMQVGGDGFTACATCHFHAGADSRSKNQLNPRVGTTFERFGPNYQLTLGDFPFPASAVGFDVNDVSGSQGVRKATFNDIHPGFAEDFVTAASDSVFNVGGINVRQATGRNTPSAINAAFNFRNFWDTRAQNDFNGANPFGARDATARVLKGDGTLTGSVSKVQIANLFNCSPASQAVGPPNNGVEMSAAGRSFPKLGKKMLSLTPLGKQLVATGDSLLGPLSKRNR